MASLLQQSGRILLGRGSVSVISILFTMFYARALSRTEFAFIVLYETAAALFMSITDLGLSFKVFREAPPLFREKRDVEAILTVIMPATVTRALFAVVVALAYGFTAWYFEEELPQELRELDLALVIPFAATGILLEGLGTITEVIFSVRQRFGMNSFLGSAQTLVEQITALAFYLYLGLSYYFVGVAIAQGLMLVLRCMFIRDVLRQFEIRRYPGAGIPSMLVKYFPFYLRRFFRAAFLQGEQILVAALLPLGQLANYNLAKRTSKFMKPYIEAFANPLMVRLSRIKDITLVREYRKTYLSFTIPLPLLMAVASPWIIQIYGDKYVGSWPILSIFYVSWVFYSLSTLQLGVVSVFGDAGEFVVADMIAGCVGLSATGFFIVMWGEAGLAWGQIVSFAALYVSGFIIARKYYRNPEFMSRKTGVNADVPS